MSRATLEIVGAGFVGLANAIAANLRDGPSWDIRIIEKCSRRAGQVRCGLSPVGDASIAANIAVLEVCEVVSPDSEIPDDADVTMFCVDTPTLDSGLQDTRNLESAISDWLARTECGVGVVRSTVLPDAMERLSAACIQRGSVLFHVPEFLRVGTAVQDCVMAGGEYPACIGLPDGASNLDTDLVLSACFGRTQAKKVVPVSLRASCMAKYVHNVSLAARLTIQNEMAMICGENGVDFSDVFAALGGNLSRFDATLKPRTGWGGPCFPKDTLALANFADSDLLLSCLSANAGKHTEWAMKHVMDATAGTGGNSIHLIGGEFKCGSGDVTDSPYINMFNALKAADIDMGRDEPNTFCLWEKADDFIRLREAGVDGKIDVAIIGTEGGSSALHEAIAKSLRSGGTVISCTGDIEPVWLAAMIPDTDHFHFVAFGEPLSTHNGMRLL